MLTQEQKRIRIAEACGWGKSPQEKLWYALGCGDFADPMIAGFRDGHVAPLPDYFGDLNAIHEAENVLNDTQHSNYRGELLKVCLSLADALCATAAQRAEAFGLALGLWEEGE